MNKVEISGRLTADPEVRYSSGENSSANASFTLAVERRFKRQNEERQADFIRCVAFGKSAEFAEKYLKKGIKIEVCGRIQTGSYTNKDGNKVYTTDVVVEEMGFCESKSSGQSQGEPQGSQGTDDGFLNIPDGVDEELPFV